MSLKFILIIDVPLKYNLSVPSGEVPRLTILLGRLKKPKENKSSENNNNNEKHTQLPSYETRPYLNRPSFPSYLPRLMCPPSTYRSNLSTDLPSSISWNILFHSKNRTQILHLSLIITQNYFSYYTGLNTKFFLVRWMTNFLSENLHSVQIFVPPVNLSTRT